MSIYPVESCQRIKMNGSQCGSPALRNRKFCHFHEQCGPVEVDVSTSAAVPAAPFLLPVLEDAASIQLAITQVCEHLLHRRLDTKKAGVLLYAMQVAMSNLHRLSEHKSEDKSQDKNLMKSSEVNRENSPEESAEACFSEQCPKSALTD
jgi:hypothetical protein